MSRVGSLVLFFGIALIILGGAHFYLYLRLVRAPQLPPPFGSIAAVALAALGLTLPLGLWLSHADGAPAKPLIWVAYIWLGFMFLLVMLTGFSDVLRLLVNGGVRVAAAARGVPDPPPGPWLRRGLAGAVVLVGLTLGVVGFVSAQGLPGIKRLEVPLPHLPRELDGFTIVQVSDLHLGPTLGAAWMAAVVDRVNELQPDAVAITGDLVDASVPELAEATHHLTRLLAPQGVYFVTGNHEYYAGVDAWVAELSRIGVHVLRNERVAIGRAGGAGAGESASASEGGGEGAGAASFDLMGIDDSGANHFGGGHGADLPRAVAGRDASRASVLLAHQPNAVIEAAAAGIGLVLSGHTHAGQIWPWGYLVGLTQPFVRGLNDYRGTAIYVSNGTGYWGPPMRLGAPAEITQIVLRAR